MNYLYICDIIVTVKIKKLGGIFINHQNNDNYNDEYDGDKPQKKSWLAICFRWTVYAVCLLIIGIVIYRLISTQLPEELKNYIIKSEKIEKAYADLKEDFRIYKISIRNKYARGDAFSANNVYYLESAENLQLTLSCKNSELYEMADKYKADESSPFKFYLKIYEITKTAGTDEITEPETTEYEPRDYIITEPSDIVLFGKSTDRYKYFVLSFDGVEIDYTKTKVELYIAIDSPLEKTSFADGYYIARFTVYDVMTSKTKVNLKKFDLGE